MTVQEVLEAACNKRQLNPNDHFLRYKRHGAEGYKVPEKTAYMEHEVGLWMETWVVLKSVSIGAVVFYLCYICYEVVPKPLKSTQSLCVKFFYSLTPTAFI